MVDVAAPRRSALYWYLTSSSLSMAALSLQGLVITWILVGVLKESADVFGESRALISTAPLLIYLVGGIAGDRVDARRLLFVLTALTATIPVMLALAVDMLNVGLVIVFGASTALLGSLADPARQGIINRVSHIDIQRSIAIVTIVPSLVGIAAMSFGTRLEQFGLSSVLLILGLFYALAAVTTLGLPRLPATGDRRESLVQGFKAVIEVPLIRRLFGMNFVSAIFNAGGYMVVMPYILFEHYAGGSIPIGDDALLTAMFIAFTIGSTGSTIVLFLLMPLRQPGRIYIALQLFRILVIVGIWLQPPPWLFLFFVGLWGINMGITSTLVRSTIQELAPPDHRSKVLAFYLFTFTLSSILAAWILGYVVEWIGALNALLPGVLVSIGLFVYGYWWSTYWQYRSQSASL